MDLEFGNVLKMAVSIMSGVTKAKANDGKIDTLEAMGLIEQVLIGMGVDTSSLVSEIATGTPTPVETPLTDMFKTLLEMKTDGDLPANTQVNE